MNVEKTLTSPIVISFKELNMRVWILCINAILVTLFILMQL